MPCRSTDAPWEASSWRPSSAACTRAGPWLTRPSPSTRSQTARAADRVAQEQSRASVASRRRRTTAMASPSVNSHGGAAASPRRTAHLTTSWSLRKRSRDPRSSLHTARSRVLPAASTRSVQARARAAASGCRVASRSTSWAEAHSRRADTCRRSSGSSPTWGSASSLCASSWRAGAGSSSSAASLWSIAYSPGSRPPTTPSKTSERREGGRTWRRRGRCPPGSRVRPSATRSASATSAIALSTARRTGGSPRRRGSVSSRTNRGGSERARAPARSTSAVGNDAWEAVRSRRSSTRPGSLAVAAATADPTRDQVASHCAVGSSSRHCST